MEGRALISTLNPTNCLSHLQWSQFLPRGPVCSLLPDSLGQGTALGKKELVEGGRDPLS